MLRKLQKRLPDLFLKPLAAWYLSKDRIYRYKKLILLVKKGVFHPGLFFSTGVLVRFLEKIDLKDKTILELGAGSGLISLVASRKGAIVTASDISLKAIENLQINSELNQLPLRIIHSDLFDSLSPESNFDYIIINPPYYPRNPTNEAEKAWFCGSEFEYFTKLFAQLKTFMTDNINVYMILSEDCKLETIENLALAEGLAMKIEFQEKTLWEWNYVFRILLLRLPD